MAQGPRMEGPVSGEVSVRSVLLYDVQARTAVEGVLARTADQDVVAVAAEQRVVPVAADEEVVACAAVEQGRAGGDLVLRRRCRCRRAR